jgi:hypothetical protein
MKARGKKLLSLFLVFSLMAISCASLRTTGGKREKHGAKLIITKKGGQQIEGELITVKPNSLLLLSLTGRDISVDIVDIKTIRIVNPSKLGKGAAIGGMVGAAGGVGSLIALNAIIDEDDSIGFEWYLIFGAVGAGICAAGGALIGSLFGIDKIIQIEGKSDSEIRGALDKLSKKARIRDYK